MSKPKIRFKGFTDDWEQRKLGDITEYRNGKGHEDKQLENGKYELINLNSISIDGGLKPSGRFVDIDEETLLKDDLVMILSDVGHGDLLGRVALIPVNNRFVLNQRVALLRVKDNTDVRFLFSTINGNQQYFKREGAGSSQLNISKDSVESFVINHPREDEQKKIGQYFLQLDNLITLHQRKYDKLVNIKKSMLEKMFPQNGASVPEIRFKGFTDDWEQCKFGDLGSVAMCKRIFKDQTSENGDIPFYKIGTFGSTPDAFISKSLYEEYKVKYQFPEVGDLLLSASGTIGRIVEYKGENAYFQDSNIIWFKHDNRLLNTFLKPVYEITEWSGIEGSTIKRLYNSNILNTYLPFTSINEQTKIGQYFSQLDNLITLHQRKIEKLKNIKKSCLEKMLV